MPSYDAMPDKPACEDSIRVLYNENRHQRYHAEELIEKAIAGNINCNEWLGHDIERRAARIIPEGYRYDRWNHVMVPSGMAFCRRCKKLKSINDFGRDKRNKGRDGTRSRCASCEAESQMARDRKPMTRILSAWKRG